MTGRAFQATNWRTFTRVYQGTPAPTALDHLVVSAPATATGGTAFNVTVTAKDAAGATLTSYRGTVILSSSDPSDIMPAAYTFVSGDAGVKVFSVTLRTGGSQTVTATDIAVGVQNVSGAIAVTALTTWNPNTIAGLVAWVRAESQVEAAGAAITTVVNQNGGTNWTTPAAAAGKRGTKQTGVFGSNARAVIRLDGVDDTYVGPILDIHLGFTLCLLFRARQLVAATTYKLATIFDDASAFQQQLQFTLLADGTLQVFVMHYDTQYNWIGRSTSPGVVVANEDTILTIRYDGGTTAASVQIYKNGTQVDSFNQNFNTFTALTGAPTRGLQVGAQADASTNPTPMDWPELVAYSAALNSTDLTTLHTQEATYYGLTIGTTPPPPPPPPGSGGPSINREETITTMDGDRNGASGWGVEKLRIQRLSNGDLYAVNLKENPAPMGPNDVVRFRDNVQLWKRTGTNTWVDQAITFEAGYQNGHAFVDGAGVRQVLGWPGGYSQVYTIQPPRPRLWDSASGTTRDLFAGQWPAGQFDNGAEWNYSAVGVDVSGNRLLLQRTVNNPANPFGSPNVPGTYNLVYRDNAGVWHGPYQWQEVDRSNYFFIMPNGSGWEMFATRDVSFGDVGITPPPGVGGGGAYAFDEVRRFYWSGAPTGQPTTRTVIRSEPATTQVPDNVCKVVDVYVDGAGNRHLLIYAKGPGTAYAYKGFHYVLDSAGTVLGFVALPIQVQNYARITQDSTGRWWFVSANGNTVYICKNSDADFAGANLGLELTAQTTLMLTGSYGTTLTQNVFAASPRSGGDSTLRDYLDLALAQDYIWVYVRIQLR